MVVAPDAERMPVEVHGMRFQLVHLRTRENVEYVGTHRGDQADSQSGLSHLAVENMERLHQACKRGPLVIRLEEERIEPVEGDDMMVFRAHRSYLPANIRTNFQRGDGF